MGWRVTAAVVAASVLPLVGAGAASATGAANTDRPAPNTVTAYGTATDRGPAESLSLAAPLVGIAGDGDSDSDGYWLAASDGGVFTFGSAIFAGSAGAIALAQPIVGIAAHRRGGYWLVASDGGVFTYGDATFHGSTGGTTLHRPIVGMASTRSGDGYWLVASDGGVFSFGDAVFQGSTGDVDLVQPIVGMATTASGGGYWLAAADGGIFSFGDARFLGSERGDDLEVPVVGIASSADGDGYRMVDRRGQVYAHGVIDQGSAAERDADGDVTTVGIASAGTDGYWLVHGTPRVSQIDDRGPRVEAIQRRLTELGYWLGPVDATFGQLTRQAVYAFQKYEGLTVDGRVDSVTDRALFNARRPVARTGGGDVIEVDKTRQLLFVVNDGAVEWVFNTSTGTEEPYTYEGEDYLADTPSGRWTITREIDGYRTSNLGRLYRPKYFHPDGIAIHGYSSVPPHAASHGCVRVTNAAIDFIWSATLAPIGADVWVYGETAHV